MRCLIRPRIARIEIAVALVVLAGPASGEITLPAILGDQMVLQRETSVPLWGWAEPGERVRARVSWHEGDEEVIADDRGRWRIDVRTPEAGGPHSITLSASNSITLSDVLIGEVWLCSGQSNMEWTVARSADAEAEIAAGDHPGMRLFTAPNRRAAAPRVDCRGEWAPCSPQTVRDFSAVGYFFGRDLHERLDVPIGLISADWGGTVAQAWMSAGALKRFPQFSSDLDRLEALGDPTRRQRYARDVIDAWWDRLDGDEPRSRGWIELDHDDRTWDGVSLPAAGANEFASFNGVVFYRRSLELPDSWADVAATLELGPIDDYDDVWVNGVHVGGEHESGRWNQKRRYAVPEGVLRSGRNVIAMRVLDTGGPGGLGGAAEDSRLRANGETRTLAGAWAFRRGRAVTDLPPMPQGADIKTNTPSVLYNGMIAPIAPFAIQGVIWYQGEANRGTAALYHELFPALIESWRALWARGDFPFLFVQIAPFDYDGDTGQTAEVREAQRRTLRVPNTGMVVTMDIGNRDDIHPRNKQDVGRRLALWARANTYHEDDLVHSGPLYQSMDVEGKAVRLRFDHLGGGLVLRESPRRHFLVAGADRQFVRADARVEGETIVVSSAEVPAPVAVRYGWEAASEPNVFNAAGLPASPFRTDDWTGTLPPVSNSADVERWRGQQPGLVPLFNGRDLTGWRNVNCGPGTWTARNGVLECTGIPTGVLRTEKQYENFILELEWRHLKPGGNAGVFVWSDPLPARGQPYTRGVEVQVLDGREGSWFTSDGDVFPIHGATMRPENGRGGSRAFPTEARSNGAPLWNHYRITCRDGSIALAVNGKVVTKGHDASPRRGYICLESEGSPIEFRAIKIETLPAAASPVPAEQVAEIAEGFETLYTGVDLAGWVVDSRHEGHWRNADWRLETDGEGPPLFTSRDFGDVVITGDWRWPDEPAGRLLPIVLSRETGMPHVPVELAKGAWGRFVITRTGGEVIITVDGQTVVSYTPRAGTATSGPIGLAGRGERVEFANLFVRTVGQ